MTRAQGALEYLLLLGGAITVAAIIIAIVLGLGSVGSGNAYNLFASAEAKKLSAQKGVDLTGLQAYYKFDGDLKDYSGWVNDGTAVGAPTYSSDARSGTALNIPQYVPPNEHYVIAKGGALTINGDFTIMLWFNANAGGSFNLLRGTDSLGTTQILLGLGPSNSVTTSLLGNDRTFGSSLPVAGWHNITWIRSGATQRVYYDCQEKGTPQSPTSAAVQTEKVYIGRGFQPNNKLDEIYVIGGRAMPQADISSLAGC